MKKFLAIAAAVAFLGGCTTTPTGQKVLDPAALQAVQLGAQIACAITPTAEQIAAIYTSNPDVKSAEAAIAILCNAIAKVPVVVVAPTPAPAPAAPSG